MSNRPSTSFKTFIRSEKMRSYYKKYRNNPLQGSADLAQMALHPHKNTHKLCRTDPLHLSKHLSDLKRCAVIIKNIEIILYKVLRTWHRWRCTPTKTRTNYVEQTLYIFQNIYQI